MINPNVLGNIVNYQAQFVSAKPFRHVVIDDFFTTDIAEQMLADFPPFQKERALNEMGEVGGKAVFENIADISSFYRQLSDYIKSPNFLLAVSELTGIKDLHHDDSMFGGGTHENLHGQELDPHVDFNYEYWVTLHRRLNLLLYLNREWEESWGGSIELHSDPRHPESNEVKSFAPIFNRCVIFETNEYSWHGFPQIQLPENKRHLSRKSFSIYLYTKDRPAAETARPHATFYIQRPLPEHIRPGVVLSQEDAETIRHLISKRDKFIEFYQQKELENGQMLKELRDLLASCVRMPLTGYGLQRGQVEGFWSDGWAKNIQASILVEQDISLIQIFGHVPEFCPSRNQISLHANSFADTFNVSNAGSFLIKLPVSFKQGETISISVKCKESITGKRAGINHDTREVAFLLTQLRLD
jgi:hypothetical protein